MASCPPYILSDLVEPFVVGLEVIERGVDEIHVAARRPQIDVFSIFEPTLTPIISLW